MELTRSQKILEEWRKNMEAPIEPDPDYEAFLEQERKEIDEILAYLMPYIMRSDDGTT